MESAPLRGTSLIKRPYRLPRLHRLVDYPAVGGPRDRQRDEKRDDDFHERIDLVCFGVDVHHAAIASEAPNHNVGPDEVRRVDDDADRPDTADAQCSAPRCEEAASRPVQTQQSATPV